MNKVFLLLAALSLSANLAAQEAAHEISAYLDWSQRVELALPQSGQVAKVAVRPGDSIKAGQTLLQLDSAPFQADLSAAGAAVKRTRAIAAETKRELERTQELYDQNLIAGHEYEVAKNAWISAQAAVEEAQAQQRRAQIALQQSRLQAPFDGLVLRRQVEPGQTVVNRCQAQTLLTVAKNRLLARAWVDAQQRAQLQQATQWQVVIGDKTYPAKLDSLSLDGEAHEAGLRFAAAFSFEAAPATLSPGQAASVRW